MVFESGYCLKSLILDAAICDTVTPVFQSPGSFFGVQN